jgi:hypothetical protein
MHIVSDEYLAEFVRMRANRLKQECSVCKDFGWIKSDGMVPNKHLIFQCRERDHVVCRDCKAEIDARQIPCCRKKKLDYSQRFTRNGVRLKKCDVTVDMIVDALNKDWIPLCPTCSVPLEKSSACNELRHCGQLSVCNFCLGIFDENHKCPRWDHDSHCNPCTNPDHEDEKKILADSKKEAILQVLRSEFHFQEAWTQSKWNRPLFQESRSPT